MTSEKTISEWMSECPAAIRDVFLSPPLMSFLCNYRNSLFQLPGVHDGAMSESCKQLFYANYRALDEFIKSLEKRGNDTSA